MNVQTLLHMSKSDLDSLWTDTVAGDPPLGKVDGTVLVVPGKVIVNRALARHIKTFAWQGKTFRNGMVTNRIAGANILAAQVYKGESYTDTKECIILDYAITPLVERLRDELRQIGPRLYLGKAYRNRKPLMYFVLESVAPSPV